MVPSRFLPEATALQSLLGAAGVNVAQRSNGLADSGAMRMERAPIAPRTRDVAPAPTRTPDRQSEGQPLLTPDKKAVSLAQVLGAAPTSLPIELRLESVLQWLIGNTGAFAAYVADTDGLPLVNRHAPETYVAATASLAQAQEQVSHFVETPVDGTTSIDIHDQNVLEVIWAPTSVGRLALGLVLAAPLERSLAAAARHMVQLAVDPEPEGTA